MSYVRDNGLARARKRRERRSMAVLGLCTLLVLGAIIFAATFISPGDKKGACASATKTAAPQSASFTVNVYNAGGAKGAAGSAADALHSHHLAIGGIGNDPQKEKLTGAGQIRFGPDGAALAKKYVAPLTPGATLVEDGRDGTSVDVVVGAQFPTITTLPTASASATCQPSASSATS